MHRGLHDVYRQHRCGRRDCRGSRVLLGTPHPFTDDVGVDAMAQRYRGQGSTGQQALGCDLALELWRELTPCGSGDERRAWHSSSGVRYIHDGCHLCWCRAPSQGRWWSDVYLELRFVLLHVTP